MQEGRAWRCPRGHSFDLARSGYLNLLQAQERRSRHPGDSKEAALARRRLFAAGCFDPLLAAITAAADEALGPSHAGRRAAVLDVGCGEGTVLAALARGRDLEGWGVDISAPAIDLAARSHPDLRWIVANADRTLPFPAGAFDLVLSITSRQNAPELRRLLAPGGRLLLAVPGADDLAELRTALLGKADLEARLPKTLQAFAADFALVAERRVRHRAALDRQAVDDLLASTYRGARSSERGRLAALDGLTVTLSHDLAILSPL